MSLYKELSFNLGLPETPLTDNPELFSELLRVYNALRNIAYKLDTYTGAIPPVTGDWGEVGTAALRAQGVFKTYCVFFENVTVGQLVSFILDGGVVKARKAKDNTFLCQGFCSTQDTAAGDVGEVTLCGNYPATPNSLTPGTVYYLSSATAGSYSSTPGPTPQIIGVAVSRSTIFFNPAVAGVGYTSSMDKTAQTGILKGDGTNITAATANTDYLVNPVTVSIASTKAGELFRRTGASTTYQYMQFQSTGGDCAFGIASSTGTGLGSGVSAYASVFGSYTATKVHIVTNSASVAEWDTSGNLTQGGNLLMSGYGISAGYIDISLNSQPSNGLYLPAANKLSITASATDIAYATSTQFEVLQNLKLKGGATLLKTAAALTDGAAAAAGTLNNAPAAGDPTKWIAIDDNGTTRYIPAW